MSPKSAGPAELPEQFGRYRILRRLGQGGMGAVYLAHDTQLDRPVALKVPHIEENEDPQRLERFLREARAAATLTHPNICPVYDVGVIDGRQFLTMAYVDGKPLSAYVHAERPPGQRQAAAILYKVALALAEAHRHGIIHRDLKPSNIMIRNGREPVVMDFGLARMLKSEEIRLTHLGAVMGTPAYMAPEQVRGESVSPAADIYSLGVVLYELLTGRLPFEGPVYAVLGQVLTQQPQPPLELRPDLDPRLNGICLRAMAKETANRTPSMDAFAQELLDFLRGQESTSSVTVPGQITAAPAAASGEISQILADLTGSRSVRGRQSTLLLLGTVGAVALGLLVTGVLTILAWQPGDRAEREPTPPPVPNAPPAPPEANPAPPGRVPTVLRDNFDDGFANGWRTRTMDGAASGVNSMRVVDGPRGHRCLVASGRSDGKTWIWTAPSRYLGDQSDKFGRILSFELFAAQLTNRPRAVWIAAIQGGGLSLCAEDTKVGFLKPREWRSFRIKLDASAGWVHRNMRSILPGTPATDDDIRKVLSNLDSLLIHGEFASGKDTCALDNVVFGEAP